MKQANHWQQVQQLFDELVQLPVAQQQSRLAELEQSSPELWADVSKMLESDAEVEDNTLPKAAAIASQLSEQPKLGTRTGPFELISELGSGGMGTVYLANRVEGNVSQKVAVKFAHGAVLDKKARERFEKEQQILANLEHSGIARLVDVGTTEEGVPYYAMEYITGLPITEYVEKHQLTADQRVDLFQQICEAVSYAHRHLVIHRDLKPANILVNEEGQVKLLDFGIAKLMSGDENDPKQTGTLGIFLSPQYAAPEQFQGRAISFATDVYALGIILYELLSGKLPYDLKGLSLAKMEQIVSNTLPRSLSNAQKFPDLDAICLHCLKKEPDQRYRSIDELLEDLKRYKSFEPIRARKPTQAYKISKFVRRNRAATIISTALAISILAFAGISKYQRDLAIEREQEANAVTDFLVTIFRDADPYRTGNPDITVKNLLDNGAEQIDMNPLQSDLVTAKINMALAHAYRGVAEWPKAYELIDNSISSFKKLGSYEEELMEALLLKVRLVNSFRPQDEIRELAKEGVFLAKEVGSKKYEFEFSVALYVAYSYVRDFESALEYGRTAVRLGEEIENIDPVAKGRALQHLSTYFTRHGQHEESLRLLNLAVNSLNLLSSNESKYYLAEAYRRRGRALGRLGQVHLARKNMESAIDNFVELFGYYHTEVADALNTQGVMERRLKNYDAAIESYEKSLEIREKVLDPKSQKIAFVLSNMAILYQRYLGDPIHAGKLYGRAIDVGSASAPAFQLWLIRFRLERLSITIDCLEDAAFVEKEINEIGQILSDHRADIKENYPLDMHRHLSAFWHALKGEGESGTLLQTIDGLTDSLGGEDEWVIEASRRYGLLESEQAFRLSSCSSLYKLD